MEGIQRGFEIISKWKMFKDLYQVHYQEIIKMFFVFEWGSKSASGSWASLPILLACWVGAGDPSALNVLPQKVYVASYERGVPEATLGKSCWLQRLDVLDPPVDWEWSNDNRLLDYVYVFVTAILAFFFLKKENMTFV